MFQITGVEYEMLLIDVLRLLQMTGFEQEMLLIGVLRLNQMTGFEQEIHDFIVPSKALWLRKF